MIYGYTYLGIIKWKQTEVIDHIGLENLWQNVYLQQQKDNKIKRYMQEKNLSKLRSKLKISQTFLW